MFCRFVIWFCLHSACAGKLLIDFVSGIIQCNQLLKRGWGNMWLDSFVSVCGKLNDNLFNLVQSFCFLFFFSFLKSLILSHNLSQSLVLLIIIS